MCQKLSQAASQLRCIDAAQCLTVQRCGIFLLNRGCLAFSSLGLHALGGAGGGGGPECSHLVPEPDRARLCSDFGLVGLGHKSRGGQSWPMAPECLFASPLAFPLNRKCVQMRQSWVSITSLLSLHSVQPLNTAL